jgi:hypothetical protein
MPIFRHFPSLMEAGDPSFFTALGQRIRAILQKHGLVPTTDVEMPHQEPGGMFSGLLDTAVDDEDDDDGDGEKRKEYDDAPAIDRLLEMAMASARKAKRESLQPPEPLTNRVLGMHPEHCAALILVGITFTPVAATDAAVELNAFGTWRIAVRAAPPETQRSFSGTVSSLTELEQTFAYLTELCDAARKEHDLKPIRSGYVEAPSYMGVDQLAGAPELDAVPGAPSVLQPKEQRTMQELQMALDSLRDMGHALGDDPGVPKDDAETD